MDRGIESCGSGDLAPGFRFYPTEEELLTFYLHNKLEGKSQVIDQAMNRVIPVLDIYEHNPWELPKFSGELCNGDPEQWFFFVPRQENEARGGRPTRLTTTGYWKGTGSPAYVYSSNNQIIGMKRSMVFYRGRAASGNKTEWKLNDYKAIQWEASSLSTTTTTHPRLRHEFSLCRVYKKSKFLRSFDRRPMGDNQNGRIKGQPMIVLDDDYDATISNQETPSIEDRISSTSQELFPIDNNGLGQKFLSGCLADEPIWDWEQLENWYDVRQYM